MNAKPIKDADTLGLWVEYNQNKLSLAKTEVSLGQTFAAIALEARNDSTRQRNRRKARLAYDSAVKYKAEADRAFGTPDDAEFNIGLATLKQALVKLGDIALVDEE